MWIGGYGFGVHDEVGDLRARESFPFKGDLVVLVELLVVYEVVKYVAFRLHVNVLWVEGNSMTVIHWLRSFKGLSQNFSL